MRITYLHQYFNTINMSGGTRSYEMSRRLVAMGHEVNLITSWREDDGRKDWFTTEESGVQVHWLPVEYSNNMSYKERVQAFLRFALGSLARAASVPADLVFATSTPLTIAIPAVYAARCQSIPMVFEVRDLWPELPIAIGAIKSPIAKFLAKSLEGFAYSQSQSIIALSPGMRDGVVSSGYPSDKVYVIPNGADLDRLFPDQVARSRFRRKYGIAEDKILIVYTGTFGRINGVDYLVRLAERLKGNAKAYFLMVGEGQQRNYVLDLANETNCLGCNVSILPPLPKSEIPDVLAAADIATSLFLPIPEMESNSANKFFDGLAAGCCMAINYGGWQADLLSSHGAGLQLSRNIEEASNQLKDLLNNPDWIVDSGYRARKLAEKMFSRDQLAQKLEQVLASTYERSRTNPGLILS
jgi:glycosyltransferase involved in cell wall biosynthesis